jgi:hypothetical protein
MFGEFIRLGFVGVLRTMDKGRNKATKKSTRIEILAHFANLHRLLARRIYAEIQSLL